MPKRIIDITPPSLPKATEGKPAEVRPKLDLEAKKYGPKFAFKKSFLIAPVLIILGAFAYFTLSKAEINVWPITETVAPQEKLTVLGALFSAEKTISGEFNSSGKKFLEQKAAGQVRIYNNYQSDQVLLINTRLQAPVEKFSPALTGQEKPWFRTAERITIPAKKYVDVKVVAEAPGEKYNIKPSKFSIPGLVGTSQYTQIYGESMQEFTGGQSKEVFIVSKDDLKLAESQLKEQGIIQNKTELLSQLPPESEFLEDSFKTGILATSSLAQAGAQVEKFNYQAKIRTEALSFNRLELEGLTKGMIVDAMAEGKKINEASFKNSFSFVSFDSKTENLILFAAPSAQIYSDINEASLKEGLSGLSLAEAKLFLENQPQIKKSQIKLWPFWQRSIPKNTEKIKLMLNL
ncbi:MAG: hypothetical protein A3A08_01970 [Candidatus Nealsonbacteria bacterium RIFCSPLOWO2_01_FULL_41_9]|uniref:Baseplate protein J-like domain-containing protein n=1 Tax=Candidatus Nealsonbacteria bacterium RIFCSPLOWO2_01_FULL_41_9 TaxID=1801671 RepID=A0A1G2EF25_9BACT|nr:MAG: hypothetical protein A3A08_01970 [Candidatus Nealsonbacteria bacterium RIFCSPLOWO2_01_FULL_41_9]